MNEEKKETNLKLGTYKHYKDKLYKVLFTAINTETKEDEVVYQAMCGDEKIWVRPKKMFLEEVEVEGKKMPRFQFIEEDKSDWQDKYKRALADYQNLLKQTAREKAEFGRFAREQFLIEILPVYDNLKMSLIHFQEDADQNNWVKGIEYVTKQFKDTLAGMGVEEIKTIGMNFDYNTMEAMDNEETEDKKHNGKVAKEIKAGYKLNGKVVMPAKVIVYKLKN